MAETPEGPMPGKKRKSEAEKKGGKAGFKTEYEAAVELVRMLRGIGVMMAAKCPKCGAEGSISTLVTRSGYRYLVIRHPDRSTHMVPKVGTNIDAILRELCEVKKDLEYILERYKEFERMGIKFCAEEGQ
jgi:hypothetical protein